MHQSSQAYMGFQQRNFEYVRKPFRTFIDEIRVGSKQYLRSLASDEPSRTPADFWADFPALGPDFGLPPELQRVNKTMHSSVLRISGPVAMWLHYDVMANVLCQINGSKRLLLYPPSDVSLFSIPPGSSSSSINCFDDDPATRSLLTRAHPHKVLLRPGDILFIPPLWLHTALPVDNISSSVNVFFRSLDSGYAPGKPLFIIGHLPIRPNSR